jgi:hypothetical protein
MIVLTLVSNSLQAFAQALQDFQQDQRVKSVIIFLPEGNAWDLSELNSALKAVHKPVIGGIFPQIIIDQQCSTQGAVFIGLPSTCEVHLLPLTADLSTDELSLQLAQWYPDQYQNNTLMVVADGLAPGIAQIIDELFNHFGLEINFIGGGAGSLTLQPQPCVLTQQGVQQQVAAIAMLNCQTGIGVAHGWEPVTDAFRVTESMHNQIISLNWQPAFEVYQQVIFEHSRQQISPENFFDIAKAYPFGLTKLGNEWVIRDPISTQQNQLICVGDVPQGSFVHVMHGHAATLPLAARVAREKALLSYPAQQPPQLQLFIDCISRVLFLGANFSEELAQAACDDIPMVGALTLGEIANCGHDYLEFYNKTAVVAVVRGD